jgi:hypothetical protein
MKLPSFLERSVSNVIVGVVNKRTEWSLGKKGTNAALGVVVESLLLFSSMLFISVLLLLSVLNEYC